MIPLGIQRDNGILAFGSSDGGGKGTLYLAVDHPQREEFADELRFQMSRPVKLFLAPRQALVMAWERVARGAYARPAGGATAAHATAARPASGATAAHATAARPASGVTAAHVPGPRPAAGAIAAHVPATHPMSGATAAHVPVLRPEPEPEEELLLDAEVLEPEILLEEVAVAAPEPTASQAAPVRAPAPV